jgi:archaellin
VVASVFAFSVLSSGVLATEQTKETVLGGLEETSATLALRGSIIAESTTTLAYVERIRFQIATATRGDAAIDMSTSSALVSYVDEDQSVNMSGTDWTPSWLIGTGTVLDQNERVEVTVTLSGLSPRLDASKEFTVRVKPAKGAVLTISRTTPAELTLAFELK